MDNEEAKFILRAYRPGGADAQDVAFAEALEHARRDPSLALWLQREQALDQAIAGKLRDVPIPPGLRESILAGGRASRPVRGRWRTGVWLALAASLVLALGAGVFWPRWQSRQATSFLAAFVIEDVLHGRHGSHGVAAGELRVALSDHNRHLAVAPPPVDLTTLRTTGCRTLKVAGHEIVEVCFLRSGEEYHFYVMAPPNGRLQTPRTMERLGAAAAVWSDGKNIYALATMAAPDALRALL